MELNLKRTIGHYQEFLGDDTPTDHHSLLKLWNLMTKLLDQAGFATNDEYGAYCIELLKHIHEADPDGERYRYPHDKKGQPFGFTKVELEGLVKAHWHITTYAEAASEMLPELAEQEE